MDVADLVITYMRILCIGLIAAGVFLIFLGYRSRPIPFVGFRVGYAYISRETWKRLNIASGISLIVISSLFLYLSTVYRELILVLFIPIALALDIVILTEYGSRLAEKELIKIPSVSEEYRRIERVRAGYVTAITIALAIAIYVAALLYYYPYLPDRIAVHFGPSGRPDLYTSRDSGLASISIGLAVTLVVSSVISYLSLRKPEAFYRPWMPMSYMYRVATALNVMIAIVVAIVLFGSIDVLHFNAFNTHIADLGIAIPITVGTLIALTIYVVALCFIAWKRCRAQLRL